MGFSFKAKIYKVGINPCVEVPFSITDKMIPSRGYIPVNGKIEKHHFKQTLCPVKNSRYRLYVNGLMLKGANVVVGETVNFSIEQDLAPQKSRDIAMPKAFKKRLTEHDLTTAFKQLVPSRKKEILKYLNYLKTEEALTRNIEKVIDQLKKRSA